MVEREKLVRFRLRGVMCCALGLFSVIHGAHATITFDFTGTVTTVDEGLEETFVIGDKLEGQYTFSPAAVDVDQNPGLSLYEFNELLFTICNYDGAASVGKIGLWNEVQSESDIYRVQTSPPSSRRPNSGIAAPDVGDLPPYQFSLQLTDMTGTAFDNTRLPLSPPEIRKFAYGRGFWLAFRDQSTGETRKVKGRLESLTGPGTRTEANRIDRFEPQERGPKSLCAPADGGPAPR